MCSGGRNMLISMATSVLHGGAQQDVPSCPAVTTQSEMKRCNTKEAVLKTQWAIQVQTIRKDNDERTSWFIFCWHHLWSGHLKQWWLSHYSIYSEASESSACWEGSCLNLVVGFFFSISVQDTRFSMFARERKADGREVNLVTISNFSTTPLNSTCF